MDGIAMISLRQQVNARRLNLFLLVKDVVLDLSILTTTSPSTAFFMKEFIVIIRLAAFGLRN